MFSQSQQSPSCYLMTMHCKLADNVDNKAGPLALLVCTASMKHWEINTVTLPMIRLGNPAISSSYNCWIWIRKRRWEWGRGKEDRGRMHAQSYMMQHKLCQLLILAQWKFIFLKTHLRAIDHMLRGKLYRLIAMSWYSKKKVTWGSIDSRTNNTGHFSLKAFISWWKFSSQNILYCLFCYVSAPSSDVLGKT